MFSIYALMLYGTHLMDLYQKRRRPSLLTEKKSTKLKTLYLIAMSLDVRIISYDGKGIQLVMIAGNLLPNFVEIVVIWFVPTNPVNYCRRCDGTTTIQGGVM
jgi:hypothetical protein